MSFLQPAPRRAFIHPAEEGGTDEQVLAERSDLNFVEVPQDIKDVQTLFKWAKGFGAAAVLLRSGWMVLNDRSGSLPDEFDVHFRREPQIDDDDDTCEWGDETALRVAPSSITNKVAMELQGVDAEGNQRGRPAFFNYRPAFATPQVPLTLVHPAFGTFWDIFHGIGQQPSQEDYQTFVDMAIKFSNFYEEEADYRDEAAEFWKKYAGVDFINELNTGGNTRCDLGARIFPLKALYAALEAKIGPFSSKSDPGFQCLQYVRLYWNRKGNRKRFRNTCYPAIAIEHLGPSIRVSAVATLNGFCSMPLTPFVNMLALQSHDLEAAEQGARLCLAVKVALNELSAFYANFTTGPRRDLFFAKCIPYPFHGCQVPPKRFADKLVYLVRERGKTPAVVKFVQRPYGEEVHRAWAAAGHAPQLHEVVRLAGGWWQVTMEYLGDGWKNLQACSNADDLRGQVLSVLATVQRLPVNAARNVGVHGDMRDVNVMVRLSEAAELLDVKFLDFDWARPQGSPSARYPPFMNHLQVNWDEDVGDGKPMLQKHDTVLLSKNQEDQLIMD